jgi:hypothetical protein
MHGTFGRTRGNSDCNVLGRPTFHRSSLLIWSGVSARVGAAHHILPNALDSVEPYEHDLLGQRVVLEKGVWMLNASAIGVATGLILVFLLLSWVSSGINELVEIVLQRRAKNLEAAMVDLLGPALKSAFYGHPLIQTLYSQKRLPDTEGTNPEEKKKPPSYVSPRTFSAVVLSLVAEPYRELAEDIGPHDSGAQVDIHLGPGIGTFQPQGKDVRIGDEKFNVIRTDDRPEGMTLTAQSLDATEPGEHKKGAVVQIGQVQAPSVDGVLANLNNPGGNLPAGVASLKTWLISPGTTLGAVRGQVEGWFNEKMDRVSGWYKRKTQFFLFVIGLVLAVALNADTLMLGRTLWNNPNLRDSVTATAQEIVRSGQSLCKTAAPSEGKSFDEQLTCLSDEVGQVKGLGLPLGWPTPRGLDVRHPSTLFRGLSGDPRTWGTTRYGGQLGEKLLGLLLTALAVSLGAPFWFDLLGRAVNLRSSGKPPTKETEEAA